MKSNDNKISHLQMLQSVISRMGSNSFSIKGWTAAIMVALYALIGDEVSKETIIITVIPVVVMWFLDTYYLVLEKKFRKLYDVVRVKNEKDIDFNMNFSSVEITMAEVKSLG